MTDFLDHLQHKFAYVAIGKFKAGKFNEAQKIYEEAVATYKTGFKGAYLLQKPGTDEAIAVILGDKMEDMQAHQTAAYEKIINKINPLYARRPTISFYQVCSEIMPDEKTEIEVVETESKPEIAPED